MVNTLPEHVSQAVKNRILLPWSVASILSAIGHPAVFSNLSSGGGVAACSAVSLIWALPQWKMC